MKLLHASLIVSGLFLSRSVLAQQAASSGADQPPSSNAATLIEDTPAQQNIAAAQLQIKADAKKVQAYNELALALLRRTQNQMVLQQDRRIGASICRFCGPDATSDCRQGGCSVQGIRDRNPLAACWTSIAEGLSILITCPITVRGSRCLVGVDSGGRTTGVA